MASINMIAARRAEKLKTEKMVRGMLLGIFAEIAVALGLLSFFMARIFSAGLTLEKLSMDLKKIEPAVQRITTCQRLIKDLEPKLELLADSRESTLLWTNIMHDLSRSMPANTWLSNVSSNVITAPSTDPKQKPTSKVVLTLAGTSVDQSLIGEAMLRFGQHGEVEKVDLNYTRRNPSMEVEAVDFDMAATLKPKEPAKKEEGRNAKN